MKISNMMATLLVGLLLVGTGSNLAAQEKSATIEDEPVSVTSTYEKALTRLWTTQDAHDVIGATLVRADATLRSQLRIGDDAGLIVTEVVVGSPAARAGIQEHDVILAAGDRRLKNPSHLRKAVKAAKGKAVKLRIMRGGKTLELSVAPEAKADVMHDWLRATIPTASKPRYRVGVTVTEAGDALRAQLRLGEDEGLVVTSVEDSGPAAKSGIETGDVLLRIGTERLVKAKQLESLLSEIGSHDTEIEYMHAGRRAKVTVVPKKADPASLWTTSLLNRLQPKLNWSRQLEPGKYTVTKTWPTIDRKLWYTLTTPGISSTAPEASAPAPTAFTNDGAKLDSIITRLQTLIEEVQDLRKNAQPRKNR